AEEPGCHPGEEGRGQVSRRRSAMRARCSRAMWFAWLVAMLASPGCRHNFANENDALREKILNLETQVDQLKRRNSELEAQVKAVVNPTPTTPEDIRLNTPQVAEISIDSLSFARDTDKDGRPDTLMVYLTSADGLGRFTQLVGTVDVSAAIVPIKSDPVSIG